MGELQTQTDRMFIHMGPQHPVNHGLWTLKVEAEGEYCVGAEALIGYIFRMIEKIGESRPYNEFVPINDRLCYAASMSWSGTYVMTVEKLMGMELNKRIQYIRVLMLELQRLASHLMWLSAYAADLGVLTMIFIAFRDREYVLDLLEHATGARMMYNYFRPGGLWYDLPKGFAEDTYSLCDYLEERLGEYDAMFKDSSVFMLRSKGIGVLSKKDALNLGATGPMLRASGVKADLRRIEPYLVYEELDFNIPSYTEGDCYARFQVRMDEMYESIKIIRQALNQIPAEGEIFERPPRRLPKGDVYFRTADPRGECGYYIIGNENKIPYRVKIKSPAYTNLAICEHLLRGVKVADIAPIVASVDLCVGEMDR
ncbi:MAG: NADH-quinone oxidoreductase subunit D [Candidatus Heimdallarchaeota archaeon]